MGFTRRPSVYTAFLMILLSLLLFVWYQYISIDNVYSLGLHYFSFVFLALATFILVSTSVEQSSNRIKRLFYVVTLITIATTMTVATSIAIVPRGGAHHSFAVRPDDFDITLEYGSWASGYYGRQEWTIFKADYAVGAVFADYFVDFVNIFVNKSVYLYGHIWVYLSLLPNHYMADTVFRLTEASFVLNGTETGVSLNPSHWLTVHWGSFDSGYRVRIDKGYTVTFFITIQLVGADYGDLGVTIPLKGDTYPMLRIDDVEVSSQLQDGIAILVSGILAGIQIQALAKPVKRLWKPKQPEATKPTAQTVSS